MSRFKAGYTQELVASIIFMNENEKGDGNDNQTTESLLNDLEH